MSLRFALLVAALGVTAALPALSWQADNLSEVNEVGPGVFEVIGRTGAAGPDYWCAAGDYAMRVLGAANDQRIYIARGRGAPESSGRTTSVQFSLDRPDGPDVKPALFLRMKTVGDNMSAAMARSYCMDRKTLEF